MIQDHIEESCPRKPVPCQNGGHGCPESAIPREALASHQTKCEFRTVGCSMPLCEHQVSDLGQGLINRADEATIRNSV